MKQYNDYQKEQNKLLLDFLLKKERRINSVEFIISTYCDQACEYCYLYKHGKELYPEEAKYFGNIIENFEILIKWLDENGFQYQVYDFFSGEFFNLPIWEDLFNIIYQYEKRELRRNLISVPTNASFLLDEIKTKKIEEWIEKFKEIGIRVFLSFSVEGPEELEKLERPLKNNIFKTDENFYQKFFDFRKKYSLSAHPMVTRNFVKDYKKNYDWWIDSSVNNDMTFITERGKKIYSVPMFLEVRDVEQWDKESLKNYKQFLKYVAKKDLETLYDNNINELALRIFDQNIDVYNEELYGKYHQTQPYIINFPYMINRMPCSIQGGPVFRVGDLAYVPCHRTCYPHFVYGYFIKENGKIVGMEANKPTLAIKIKSLNPNRSTLKCADCPIKAFCMKQCLGSQYEHTNELFCADERLCDLFYTKYKTIHEIVEQYDLYNWVEKQQGLFTARRKEFIKNVRDIITKL